MMHPELAAVIDRFGAAMAEAERHRTILRNRYGLSDRQIGLFTLHRQRRSPMQQLAAATNIARQRLAAKKYPALVDALKSAGRAA